MAGTNPKKNRSSISSSISAEFTDSRNETDNALNNLPIISIDDSSVGQLHRVQTEPCNIPFYKERSGSAGSSIRKTSMAVLIPKPPGQKEGSCESINQSPQSSSPGCDVDLSNMRIPDSNQSGISLSRKESYKDQRKKYRSEKKRVAKELLSTLKDPSVVVLADWLKVRGSLKGWTKLWSVLKPGMLLLYKSSKTKSSHWTGTVLLNTCELIERPSKKDGFCFKLFHPLEQSIWATKGPEGESIGAMVQPLPSSHLIFRAPSQAAGKCWMDALELSARCSSIVIRSVPSSKVDNDPMPLLTSNKWDESDYEKHFKDQDASDDSSPGVSPDLSPVSSPQSIWKDCDLQIPFSSVEATPTHSSSKSQRLSRLSTSSSGGGGPKSPSALGELSPAIQKSNKKFFEGRDPSPTPYYRKLAVAIALADQELQNNYKSLSLDEKSIAEKSKTPVRVVTSVSLEENRPKSSRNLDDASHTDEYEEPQRESGQFSGAELLSDSESGSEDGSGKNEEYPDYIEFDEETVDPPVESNYVYQPEGYIGETGEQTEELAEENKSLIWFLLKQVRPGMDLSKVVLPTFILEPRSFLDKLSDYYFHADFISKAVLEDDPYTRMKEIVRWYFSGFYKKPKGLKKPYNPILGETFRCYWKHPNGSKTFYVAEQVSHHPPVSALYVTNRQEGFAVSATILAKSKFYGNSTSAILDGNARLTLLPRGEDYVMNMPYAHCKGILMGTLSMELGGKVSIECEKTGYAAELEFKLKPFLSVADSSNYVSGKLRLGKKTMATIDGRWDRKISITDKRTGEEELLWEVTKEIKESRLPRYTVSLDQQGEWESEKLWNLVSIAIKNDDQEAATVEKTILEEAQRAAARELKIKCEEVTSKYFYQDLIGSYVYEHSDLRPWDPRTDMFQYEYNYDILTKTRHKAPMIRTASIISVELQKCEGGRTNEGKCRLRGLKDLTGGEETSSGELDELHDAVDHIKPLAVLKERAKTKELKESLEEIKLGQKILTTEVKEIRKDLESLQRRLSSLNFQSRSSTDSKIGSIGINSWYPILVALVLYSLLQWALSWMFWL